MHSGCASWFFDRFQDIWTRKMRRTETRSCEVTGLVVLLGSPRLTIGQSAELADLSVQAVRY